ncbi:hypothetical protein JT359_03665 [Candidatus Poribacteria bacterium]|nr:hypothetical protein [Candidatus Poribacteria bacterium]
MSENREQIAFTAEADAATDCYKIIWFFAGLGLTIIGVILGYIYQQEPPASRFLDKSHEFIVVYTDAYKAKLRSIQVMYSVVGLLISVSLIILYIAVIFSFAFRI